MSALGLIFNIYRGGVIRVALNDPVTANRRHGRIWGIAKEFGQAVAVEARQRSLPMNSLVVWTTPLLVGLVTPIKCYWIFCDWPGGPTVYILDLQGPEPPSVDALLAGADIQFADTRYAFALEIGAIDAPDALPETRLKLLVDEFFDFHLGVRRRAGDDPSDHDGLLVIGGRSRTEMVPPEPGWRVRVKGSAETTALLQEVFRGPQLTVRNEDGRPYLRSSDFAGYLDPTDVLNHGNQLLHLAAAVVHLWAGNPADLRAESAERVGEDGAVGGQLTSALISFNRWSRGGKAVLAQPGPGLTKTLGEAVIHLGIEDSPEGAQAHFSNGP